jgi:hypothetical protein
VKVAVLRRPEGRLAIQHGPRKLAEYDASGRLMESELKAVRKSAATDLGGASQLRTKRTFHLLQNRTVLFVANSF